MSDAAISLPPILRERLAGGATVAAARRPGVPLAAVRFLVRAGAARDPRGRHGLAHLAAEAARRGTRRRTGERVDREVESLGAELGSSCDEDAATLGLSAPAECLEDLLDVLLDVATSPSFPAPEVGRLRRRALAALEHDLDEPGVLADRALLHHVYGGHPYGHAVEGRRRHLAALRRGDALDFHARWYGPTLSTLVVVGAVDPEATVRLARRHLEGWRPAAGPPPPLPPAGPVPSGVLVVDKPDLTQTQIRIAAPGLTRASPEYFPAIVAGAVFGGGFTSRLVEEVRVNRGLSYGVRARFAMSREAGFFYVSTFTKVETTADIVEVILGESARFRDSGPTAEELSRAQSYLAGLYPLTLETHDQLAERLCDIELYDLSLGEIAEYRERVRAVTAESCREVARRCFPGDAPALVAVGPARPVARALERYGPVTVVPARGVV